MLKINIGKFLVGRIKGRFAKLSNDAVIAGKEATTQFADDLAERIKFYIEMGGRPSTPLSEYTIKHKRNPANKDRALIDTGQYLNSIQKIKTYEIRNAIRYEVAPVEGTHNITGENLRKIGMILEFGDPHNQLYGNPAPIPARPHFEPAYEDVLREKGDIFEKRIEDVCKEGIL